MPSPELDRRRFLALTAAGLALPRLAGALTPTGGWAGPEPVTETLSGGTLVLSDGTRLDRAGIRIEDGVVVELGAGVRGGTELEGAWIVPGLVDAGCQVGLWEIGMEGGTRDDGMGGGPVAADARVADAYNVDSAVLPVTRVMGITTVVVMPGGGRLISGQAATFHTAGLTREEALVQAPTGLCLNLGRSGQGGEGGASSRMELALKLRELFAGIELPEASEEDSGRRKRRKKEGGDGPPKSDADLSPGDLVLRQLRRGELKALIKAERADDILLAIELAAEHGLDAVLVGGAEAWRVAPELAASGMPVLLGPVTVQPDSFEHLHARYDNAARLHGAGVAFALRSGANHFARGLPVEAAVAVAHGLPWEAAMAALTGKAGQILGIPGVGALEVGLPACLSITDGDPLQPRTRHLRMMVAGRETSMETRQTRLYERFRTLP